MSFAVSPTFYLGQERALGLIVVYLIKLCKTVKAHGIAGGGEQAVFALGGVLLVGARYFELRRILHAARHKARHEALPDEIVELILIRGQGVLDALGGYRRICGADSLVAVLRVGSGFIIAGLVGQILLAEKLLDSGGRWARASSEILRESVLM